MRLPLLSLAACIALPAAAQANWERLTIRSVQETTLNATEIATFRRDAFHAASGMAVSAGAPLIQQGIWSGTTPYSPTSPGGAFSLLLLSQPADPDPPSSYDAISSPSTGRSLNQATNQLQGQLSPSGDLLSGPGNRASQVNLTASQTLSVF